MSSQLSLRARGRFDREGGMNTEQRYLKVLAFKTEVIYGHKPQNV